MAQAEPEGEQVLHPDCRILASRIVVTPSNGLGRWLLNRPGQRVSARSIVGPRFRPGAALSLLIAVSHSVRGRGRGRKECCLRVTLQARSYRAHGAGEVKSKLDLIQGGNTGDDDQSGDQAILDGRDTGRIFDKPPK